ncbi:MAG: initiation factor 2B [Chloroflexaceae bacterium]|nr:initiation factor 2B [Chloroflexaceae bacterium]
MIDTLTAQARTAHPLTDQALAAIAANHQAGAAEIAEQAASALLQYINTDESPTPDTFRQHLLTIGWEFIRAQPTMAPLVNLVNSMLWDLESRDSVGVLRQRASNAASTFRRRLHVHEAAIAESVLQLIPEKARVLTMSRSSTVLAALRHAHRAGRRFSVICGEGRPGCEGQMLATELSEQGIPATLVIDALAIAMVAQSHLVLVGADHLREHELVNKVGTYGMALAARASSVPIYALCGSDKFLPPGYRPPPQTVWPARQVWDNPPDLVTIRNIYFDHTPLSLMTGIVTEKGVLPTIGIEAWMAAIRLHPSLKESNFGF